MTRVIHDFYVFQIIKTKLKVGLYVKCRKTRWYFDFIWSNQIVFTIATIAIDNKIELADSHLSSVTLMKYYLNSIEPYFLLQQ